MQSIMTRRIASVAPSAPTTRAPRVFFTLGADVSPYERLRPFN